MMIGVAQVIGTKPIANSFFSSGPVLSTASALAAPSGNTLDSEDSTAPPRGCAKARAGWFRLETRCAVPRLPRGARWPIRRLPTALPPTTRRAPSSNLQPRCADDGWVLARARPNRPIRQRRDYGGEKRLRALGRHPWERPG